MMKVHDYVYGNVPIKPVTLHNSDIIMKSGLNYSPASQCTEKNN